MLCRTQRLLLTVIVLGGLLLASSPSRGADPGPDAPTDKADLTILFANLQFPPTLSHVISAVDSTDRIYGQLYIDGAHLRATLY